MLVGVDKSRQKALEGKRTPSQQEINETTNLVVVGPLCLTVLLLISVLYPYHFLK